MSTAVLEARAALRYLRTRQRARGPSTWDRLYVVYLFVLSAGILGFMGFGTLQSDVLARVRNESVLSYSLAAPGLFGLVLLWTLRTAIWQGPVVFSRADAALLLSAPLPRAGLIRPRLTIALAGAWAVGAFLGLVFFVALQPRMGVAVVPLLVAATGAMSLYAIVCVSAAWAIERFQTGARAVLRLSPLILAIALIAIVLSEGIQRALVWSGPWGWASAPILHAMGVETPGWQIATGLLVLTTVAAVIISLRSAGEVALEELSRRAEQRSGLMAATYVLDMRGVQLLQQRAFREVVSVPRSRLRRPRRTSFAIPWRDAISLLRARHRVASAAVLVAAAVYIAASEPDEAGSLALATLAGYFAAARLVEPIRMEGDDADAARRLPLRWPDVVVLHGGVPLAVMTIVGWVTLSALTLLGRIPPDSVWSWLVAGPFVAWILIACALHVGARGRMPVELLFYGFEYAIVWLAVGPLLAIIGVFLPSFALSSGASTDSGATGITTAAIIAALATVLLRRKKMPE